MEKILVCDDEKDIVSALEIYLKAEGYEVLKAYDGNEALQILEKNDISLVLMDIMMPKLDGISATSKIRESYNVPLILLTAKGESTDKVMGLTVGADDYITKPFNAVEVIARVKAQLRRYIHLGSAPKLKENVFRVESLELDDDQKRFSISGEDIKLTPTEYAIMKILIKNPGRVHTSKEIYEKIDGFGFGAENTIAVHVRHLREKIEIDPANPRYLKVVWGQGYKLEGDYCESL